MNERIAPDTKTLLIVGASARHLAQSATVAGFSCVAVDLFGDWDLRRIAQTIPVSSLDSMNIDALLTQVDTPPDKFVICGGMETRPEIVRQIAKKISFAGPDIEQLIRTQDPFLLSQVCQELNIEFPKVVDDIPTVGNLNSQSWVCKPHSSAGGQQIRFWAGETEVDFKENYLQQYIRGQSMSAHFAFNRSGTILLGSTLQLVGESPFVKKPFAYCGSIGPSQLGQCLEAEVTEIGSKLATEFQLQGCFGIDFVVATDGRPWLIEINPRITASAEVLEGTGMVANVMETHLISASEMPIPAVNLPNTFCGKAILYSPFEQPLIVNDRIHEAVFRDESQRPTGQIIRDIPIPGTTIRPGSPIASLMCFGNNVDAIRDRLEQFAFRILEQIDSCRTIQARTSFRVHWTIPEFDNKFRRQS